MKKSGTNIIASILVVLIAATAFSFAGCDKEQPGQAESAPQVAAADVLGYYQAILTFPRSGDSYPDRIDSYLLEQAEILGVDAEKDADGNVIMRAPATDGMEGVRPLAMLAYTGAVIAHDPSEVFDPQTDGVSLVHSDEHVHADGLSMGASGALGAATMLAVLGAAESHSEIVCVFAAGNGSVTSADAVTDGAVTAAGGADEPEAHDLPFGIPEGAALIGFGDEGTGIVTDAFPAATVLTAETTTSAVQTATVGRAYVIAASGFRGGPAEAYAQTGEPRLNAISVVSRILSETKNAGCAYGLCSFSGGSDALMRPDAAQAVVVLGDYEERQFRKVFNSIADETMDALGGADSGADVRMIETTKPPLAIDENSVSDTLAYLYGISGLDIGSGDDAPLALNVGTVRFDTESFRCGISILGNPTSPGAIDDVVSDLHAFERLSGISSVRAGDVRGYAPSGGDANDAPVGGGDANDAPAGGGDVSGNDTVAGAGAAYGDFRAALSEAINAVTGEDAEYGYMSAAPSELGAIAGSVSVARIGIPVFEAGTPEEYFDKQDAAVPANIILDFIKSSESVQLIE